MLALRRSTVDYAAIYAGALKFWLARHSQPALPRELCPFIPRTSLSTVVHTPHAVQ